MYLLSTYLVIQCKIYLHILLKLKTIGQNNDLSQKNTTVGSSDNDFFRKLLVASYLSTN